MISTQKVPLTFDKFEKPNLKIFILFIFFLLLPSFFLLSSFFFLLPQEQLKNYMVFAIWSIPNDCLYLLLHTHSCFELHVNYEFSFSESDVWHVVCSLNPDTAKGPEEISTRLLKECVILLTLPFTKLFNCCLSSAFQPTEWKTHTITPVFKSGNRSSVTNYRPISLLCVTSQVLEKLAYQNIIEFLHPQLSPH